MARDAVLSRLIVTLPIRPRERPDAAHSDVWLTDLSDLTLGEVAMLGGRAQQVRGRRLRQRFLLRLLLGSYLNRPGRDVRIERRPQGKPVLAPESGETPLHFSVSHSGDWLAVAVASDYELGVDIERERTVRRSEALARRFFSPAEVDVLAALPEPARSRRFLRLWCRREALVKAMGTSLARSLSQIALDPETGAVLQLPRDWPRPANWQLNDLALPNGLIGAVASCQGPCQPRLLELDCRAGAAG